MFLKRYQSVLLFIGLYILGILVYMHGLTASYYYDDFLRVFTNPHEAIWQGFIKANYLDKFYRPLETMVMAAVQIAWGRSTLAIHLLNILLHTCTAYLVFHVLRRWKASILVSGIAAVITIISQLSAAAIVGNDTQSQLTASLCAALSLWLFYRFHEEGEQRHWRYYTSIVLFFLALISKETSAGLVLSISILVATLYRLDKNKQGSWMKIIGRLVPYGVMGLVYVVLRFNSGAAAPQYGTENYTFHIGANIVQNIGLLFAQSILPVSSISMAKVVRQHDLLALAAIGIGMLAVLWIYIIGLRRQPWRIVLMLCLFIFCSWIPTLLLNHINEPYAYNALPFIGVLFGLALQTIERYSAKARMVYAILLAAFIAGNIAGVIQKSEAMAKQGERADALLPQVIELARHQPPSATVYLVDPRDSEFKYTTFSLGGFRVIACADSVIHYYSGRSDVGIEIIQDTLVPVIGNGPSHSFYTYDPTTLKVVAHH